MLKYLALCMTILIITPIFSTIVFAEDEDTPNIVGGSSSEVGNQERTSRFLSAEAQKLIKDEMEIVQKDLRSYQDENFIALDTQMKAAITQAQQKIILGALGAILLGGAAVAYYMFHIAKKYSYEQFLQKHVASGTFTEETPSFSDEEQKLNNLYQDQNVQNLQNKDWGTKKYENSVSSDYGQSFASNNSEFSNWQTKPAYHGGWKWDRK